MITDDNYGCLPGPNNFRRIAAAMEQKPTPRVPALERRYPPGCPDPDWCAGNNICYWECTRNFDIDSES